MDRGLLNHLRAACLAAEHQADYYANVAGSHFTVFRPMIDRGLLNHLRAACLAADHLADYHANVAGSHFTVFLTPIAHSHSASSFSVPPSLAWTEAYRTTCALPAGQQTIGPITMLMWPGVTLPCFAR